MKTPKISIIVPVYNVEQYISECIESLINQTLKDIEIIFVDDCGTDNSLNIVNDFAKRDKRIIILRLKNNSGVSACRNAGIKHAHAPYIMFCDSDDFYSPTMCEEMLNAIENSGADIAMCGTNIIYETDEKLKLGDDEYYRVKYEGTHEVTNDIVNNSDVSAWNKICKKEFFDKYNIQYPFGLRYEDAYFFRIYMLWAKKITFINKKLHNYRRRTGSIMNQTFKRCDMSAADHLKIAFEIFNYMNKYNKYEENYDYFWKSIFIPYFNFARWNIGKTYRQQTYNIASEFAKKHYIPGRLDFYTERALAMIKNKTLEKTKKYLFGLFKIKESIDKKTYHLLGLRIYKIKIKKNSDI
ncbi:MAG: glycosyltransferase family 2 protein [Elusimicrobiaceae bacterium]|nr:glycosyltransferase family 2 protein [Elusimicrobiaceae bacterium]